MHAHTHTIIYSYIAGTFCWRLFSLFLLRRGPKLYINQIVRYYMMTGSGQTLYTISFVAGSDYNTAGVIPGSGNSNLRYRTNRPTPNQPFVVQILDDDILEPVEVIDVILECEAVENCYAPQRMYTITIVDDQDGTFYHDIEWIQCMLLYW